MHRARRRQHREGSIDLGCAPNDFRASPRQGSVLPFGTMTARAFDDDPVLAALARAPVVPFTDEERAMVAAAEADGRPGIPHAEVMAKVERMRIEQGE